MSALAGAASANITITPIWDSTITSNPNSAQIQSTINQAIGFYQSNITTNITVSIRFQAMSSGLGSSSTYFANVSYSTWRAALAGVASSANDATALAGLPVQSTNPVNGSTLVSATTANWRALGINVNPPSGQPDSTISLNFGIMNLSRPGASSSNYDLMAVVMHEINEALGNGSALNGLANGAAAPTGSVWPMDMFRYDGAGNRSFNTTLASTAFFSINGTTNLVGFNQPAGGDYSDFFSTGPHTPRIQDAFGTAGAEPNMGVENTMLDVIGYNYIPTPSAAALLALGGAMTARRRR
jgi:hypothetical protein